MRYDTVVKDLFQKDRPTLLGKLAGPAEVRELLNSELPIVEERITDFLLAMSDGALSDRLVDVGEFDARELMASGNPGDVAWAVLACEAKSEQLRDIVWRACASCPRDSQWR